MRYFPGPDRFYLDSPGYPASVEAHLRITDDQVLTKMQSTTTD